MINVISLFIIFILCLPILGFTKNSDANHLFIKNQIDRRYITGSYPTFKDKKFSLVNHSINHFIYQELTSDMGKIELDYNILSLNNNWVSFGISYDVSNFTERYFMKYYTVDLVNKKQILLADYLKSKGIKQHIVNQAINDFIEPCFNEEKFDYCLDVSLDTLLNSNEYTPLDIKNHSSFYIKDNQTIIIAFDSYKFTVPFSFNIDTNTIGTNY
jgi:hypothetical protein